jgi:PPPDE putative peptidase domain
MTTEEERIMSSAWSQLAELGYGKETLADKRRKMDLHHDRSTKNDHDCTDAYQMLFDDVSLVRDVDQCSEDSSATDDLLQRIRKISEIKPKTSITDETQLLVAQIASVHLTNNDADDKLQMMEIGESRSTLSSPGKSNYTLRQRLSQMSRKDRRELLLKQDYTGDKKNNETNSICNKENIELDQKSDDALTRLRRQNHYGQCRNDLPIDRVSSKKTYHAVTTKSKTDVFAARTTNRILLHVYDLFSSDTLMQLPWGCVCEIGKCFTQVNTALLTVGTGIYHVGIEVNGIEYAYGATKSSGKTGVFSCIPKTSPGYQYRTSIDFGDVSLIRRTWVTVPGGTLKGDSMTYDVSEHIPTSFVNTSFHLVEEFVDGRQIIREMTSEYMGIDYDLLRKNCCTFAHDACLRLGLQEHEVPTWFRNLAETGAMTQDVANVTIVQPIHKVFSGFDHRSKSGSFRSIRQHHEQEPETGFEVVPRHDASDSKDVVIVLDVEPNYVEETMLNFGRTTSWAY